MKITRTSMMSGKAHTLDVNVTEDQIERYESGSVLLQDAFPNLTPSEREFMKTGITPKEWDDMFGGMDDEDDEEDMEENAQTEAFVEYAKDVRGGIN